MELFKNAKNDFIKYEHVLVDKERIIQDLLEMHPEIIDDDITIIGREVYTEAGEYIDLFGLNKDLDTIIIETKKGKTPKDTLTQISGYRNWVKKIKLDNIIEIVKKYNPSVSDKLKDSLFEQNKKLNKKCWLYIVAEEIHPKIKEFVEDKIEDGIYDTFCVELNCHKHGNDEFWSKDIIVGKTLTNKNISKNIKNKSNSTDKESNDKVKEFSKIVYGLEKDEGWKLNTKYLKYYVGISVDINGSFKLICALKKGKKLRVDFDLLKHLNESQLYELEPKWKWNKNKVNTSAYFKIDEPLNSNEIKNVLKKSYEYYVASKK